MERLYGGIEAGGTKFVCAVGTGPADIREEIRFPTTTPAATFGQAAAFFDKMIATHGPLSALGIASFGPVDLSRSSPRYGYITTTPKPGWENTDFAGFFKKKYRLPLGFDTDVNGAALAEGLWGAARGLSTFVYLTVGTGLGGGGLVEGRLLHGLVHPEMGHMLVRRNSIADPFAGNCPFHGDCLEGLASGPALEKRWGKPASELAADHPGWDLEADYLAQGLVNIIYVVSPQRIILGGGVMEQKSLLGKIRNKAQGYLAGYVRHRDILENIDDFIVAPALGNRAGILGAFALALKSLEG